MNSVLIEKFVPKLPIDEIEISKENVRRIRREAGIEKLEKNIQKFNLIQPVLVFAKKGRYELIVGQRRYLAFEKLGKKTIPALIIRNLDHITQAIISYGENVHRKGLPYEDSIRVCDDLFKDYSGSRSQKVKKIADDLGIGISTVTKYLAHKLVPKEVQHLVTEEKLSQDVAYRITAAIFPDTEKIIKIAKQATRLTKAETQRVIEYGKTNPRASINDILNYAKHPPPFFELTIQIEPNTDALMKKAAKKNRVSITTLVKDAINLYLEEEGLI